MGVVALLFWNQMSLGSQLGLGHRPPHPLGWVTFPLQAATATSFIRGMVLMVAGWWTRGCPRCFLTLAWFCPFAAPR